MKSSAIKIGCSAFNNVHWKGIFYPEDLPRTKWFDFYARQFKTYELNGTFYRTPTVKSLQSWFDKTLDDFVFSVKAPRNITHYKRFVNIKEELDGFYAICRDGLMGKLGCVLFQCPPSFAYTAEKLSLIVENLDPKFNNVIEFRHQSWWDPHVFETMQKKTSHSAMSAIQNFPKISSPLAVSVTSDFMAEPNFSIPIMTKQIWDTI